MTNNDINPTPSPEALAYEARNPYRHICGECGAGQETLGDLIWHLDYMHD